MFSLVFEVLDEEDNIERELMFPPRHFHLEL